MELADGFRSAMRRHSAGVCIVSVGRGEAVNGMAVTSATSFSLEPASMLVCVNRSASMSDELREGCGTTLTLLGRQHEAVAAAFARKPSGRPRFDTGSWRFAVDGPPWLEDALANLSCTLDAAYAYGTHRALVARVTAVRLGPAAESLVYRDGTYR